MGMLTYGGKAIHLRLSFWQTGQVARRTRRKRRWYKGRGGRKSHKACRPRATNTFARKQEKLPFRPPIRGLNRGQDPRFSQFSRREEESVCISVERKRCWDKQGRPGSMENGRLSSHSRSTQGQWAEFTLEARRKGSNGSTEPTGCVWVIGRKQRFKENQSEIGRGIGLGWISMT